MDCLSKHGLYYSDLMGFVVYFIKWWPVIRDTSVTEKCKHSSGTRLKLKMLLKLGISYLWIPIASLGPKTSMLPPSFSTLSFEVSP